MINLPLSDQGDDDLPELPTPDVEFMSSGTDPADFTEAGIKGDCDESSLRRLWRISADGE